MIKSFMVAAMVLGFIGVAHAGTYADAMKTCGAEWKASEARKAVTNGNGGPAWQAFRKECTARVGYEKKKK